MEAFSDTESVRSELTANPVAPTLRNARKARKSSRPQRAAMDGYNARLEGHTGDSLLVGEQETAAAVLLLGAVSSSCEGPAAAADSSAGADATPAVDEAQTSAATEPAAQTSTVDAATASPAAESAAHAASCKSSKKARQDLAGPCCHCGAVSSPQWRKGPKGKPILCNACGIRFLRNRTLTKVLVRLRWLCHMQAYWLAAVAHWQ
eukprot:GHRQ01007149.1.p1 GENE.GHRQ01007149.1~~GHRQ01007149.1.p1  ORF type:complete len:206 (+),score=40.01 GHRQ01007149.1:345-962(+)